MSETSTAVRREEVVPADHLDYHQMMKHVVGDFMPPISTLVPSNDKGRVHAVKVLSELHGVYSRHGIYSSAFSYGIIQAVHFASLLVTWYGVGKAVEQGRKLLQTRLSAIDDIEAVFFTHSWFHEDNHLVNQHGAPVSDGEVFTFGFRRGLAFALTIVETCTLAERKSGGFFGIPSMLASFGGFAGWGTHELPKLHVAFNDSPQFSEVDLLQSWGVGSMLMQKITGINVLGRGNFSDNVLRRFQNDLELSKKFIRALRADLVHLHMFRLGFGREGMVAKPTNGVFNLSVEPSKVSFGDVIEVVQMFLATRLTPKKRETWIAEPVQS